MNDFVSVFISEDLGKDLEKSLNESGLDGQTLFVNCDISVETDVQV